MPQADQRPRIGQPALDAHQEVGRVRRARRLVQHDALVVEIEALADGDAQPLGAGVAVDDARRQRERQLIRVADPVVPEVAVDAEELAEIEIVDRGVEDRRIALVAVGNVDVERARLERLHAADAERLPVALEHEAGVDGGDRNRVALRARDVGADLVEVVLAQMHARARGDVPGRALARPGDRRPGVDALAGGEARLAKVGVLAGAGERESRQSVSCSVASTCGTRLYGGVTGALGSCSVWKAWARATKVHGPWM